jgi:hypothetical protein
MSESGIGAGVNLLTGRSTASKTVVNTSKSYSVVRDAVFEPKIFAELRNAQSIGLAYDSFNRLEKSQPVRMEVRREQPGLPAVTIRDHQDRPEQYFDQERWIEESTKRQKQA